MGTSIDKLIGSGENMAEVVKVYLARVHTAQERFAERMKKALERYGPGGRVQPPWAVWEEWFQYATDAVQRSILFCDVLRERGNVFLEHEEAGKPPVLHFDYEIVADGRELPQPVNYALARIVPPEGVDVNPKRRPYVIIDPRAGHGPGIGGFKDDSQVGVALRDGHPVYFVIFFPEPEPGQTMLDVCEAEHQFIHKVREMHPDSSAPVVVGNCQGGWAAIMLAASAPDDTGPIVVNGAPLSYWGGARGEEEGNNPMRYAGGLLGGSWPASLTADLGAGKFDGAHLVQNFENLNPANTFWEKYYHLYRNVDTERERFLDFERWWGGFFLLNEAEINWIVQNLFVGNKLAAGGVSRGRGDYFDLRTIRSPIIVFASMGDNITPPQQAFNWIADLYESTEEIKARGQVIVGLLHKDIGHLGIFVSGRVARKEHTQIVSVLKSIEALPPGLWGMEISEERDAEGKARYEVTFVERRLEDLVENLNRSHREHERAFEAVAAVSEFNQKAYDLFARPLVRAATDEGLAAIARDFHPLRLQRWAFSDLNPFLWWLNPTAEKVRENRQEASESNSLYTAEKLVSEGISASLDLYRDLRDAASEAMFFTIYGNIFAVHLAGRDQAGDEAASMKNPRELPWVKEALADISKGGYAEAVIRLSYLLQERGVPIPLSLMEMKQTFMKSNPELLPDLPQEQLRRVRGSQSLIVMYEPEAALRTLPALLGNPGDRDRFLTLLDRVGEGIEQINPTPEQRAILQRIRSDLTEK